MILNKTWYKTNNDELLIINEIFIIQSYYLEGYKYEVLVLIDYINLQGFIDIKILSFRQVHGGQKLSKYHF